MIYCVLQDVTEKPTRNGDTHTEDDVFSNSDGDVSEHTRLLPLATVSVAKPPSVPQLVNTQHAPNVIQNDSKTYRNDSTQYEELVMKVVRSAGAGLGISIAGGTGSVPYRDDDQVC